MNKPNQTEIEPITRVERGGIGANLSKAASPNPSHRWRLIVILSILIAGAVAIYLHLNPGEKQGASKGAIPPLPISTVVTAVTIRAPRTVRQ